MKTPYALTLLLSLIICGAAYAQHGHFMPKSGYDFLTPDLQALQDDSFENPGYLWVELGREAFQTPNSAGKACSQCHGEGGEDLVGVAAEFPKYNENLGRVVNLEQQINYCRQENLDLEPLAFESEELLAITAFVGEKSHGMPLNVATDGQAAQSFANGEAYFNLRQGQLDLSCANCHQDNVGTRLRGEEISQGQINGFPQYRQMWQGLTSTQRMFAWCNEAVRAEPELYGSQVYIDLELFLKARGAGLNVETPAVRK